MFIQPYALGATKDNISTSVPIMRSAALIGRRNRIAGTRHRCGCHPFRLQLAQDIPVHKGGTPLYGSRRSHVPADRPCARNPRAGSFGPTQPAHYAAPHRAALLCLGCSSVGAFN